MATTVWHPHSVVLIRIAASLKCAKVEMKAQTQKETETINGGRSVEDAKACDSQMSQ